MGLIVPKLKQTSVSRNRLKRRLRELARVHVSPARLPVDVVIRVRSETYVATFDELHAEIRTVVAQLTRWAGSVVAPTPAPPPDAPPP